MNYNRAKLRILLVEDEKIDLLSFKRAFQGFQGQVEITEFVRAEQALERLEKDASFDLVVSDHNLPGMTGLELCEQIRSRNPLACLYAMTGYGRFFEVFTCREAGFDDYFLKPLSVETILKAAAEGVGKIDRWTRKVLAQG